MSLWPGFQFFKGVRSGILLHGTVVEKQAEAGLWGGVVCVLVSKQPHDYTRLTVLSPLNAITVQTFPMYLICLVGIVDV